MAWLDISLCCLLGTLSILTKKFHDFGECLEEFAHEIMEITNPFSRNFYATKEDTKKALSLAYIIQGINQYPKSGYMTFQSAYGFGFTYM